MKNTNEKINAKEYEAVELTDEELAKVVGGGGPCSCPNDYTTCTEACLNASCGKLELAAGHYHCVGGVSGNFKAANSGIDELANRGSIGKLAKQ